MVEIGPNPKIQNNKYILDTSHQKIRAENLKSDINQGEQGLLLWDMSTK